MFTCGFDRSNFSLAMGGNLLLKGPWARVVDIEALLFDSAIKIKVIVRRYT